jgi:hypothetical protein
MVHGHFRSPSRFAAPCGRTPPSASNIGAAAHAGLPPLKDGACARPLGQTSAW